jgi:hypothetical protein
VKFIGLFLFILLILTPPVMARSLDKSPRPLARGTAFDPLAVKIRPKLRPAASPATSSGDAQPLAKSVAPHRPKLRPASEQELAMQQIADSVVLASASAVLMGQSLHPALRPDGLEKKAMARRQQIQRGAICGDSDLQGEVVGTVQGKISGCGVDKAIRLKSVAGVRLSQPAVIDCGVQTIKVAAHFACRTRNNQAGARISEHGKGRAIDISGFTFRDGSKVTLLEGWRSSKDGPALKKMHKAACGPFGTVLGPNSNRFHQDHFHFDTARYRSGSYCR